MANNPVQPRPDDTYIDPLKLPALWPPDYEPPPPPPDRLADSILRCRCHPMINSVVPTDEALKAAIAKLYPRAAPAPTSLVPPETKPPDPKDRSTWLNNRPVTDTAVIFRHSGWARTRRLVRQALVDLEITDRPLQRFDRCGADPWVVVDESDSTRLAIHSDHCHNRWCTPCSRERAARIVGNLKATLTHGDIRFLTLTIKHSDAPLADQIDRIYASFRKLRRAPFWNAAVSGGCAILELKHSFTTHCWHVHLHCLLDGRYIRHQDVQAEWWRITGDSYIVDIRRCYTPAHASHYVTKYITKPVPSTVINKPEPLREMISALAHRRLVLTWGTWRGVRLSAPLDSTTWKLVGSLPELYRRRDAGNLDAYVILTYLERSLPEASIQAGRDPPDGHDDPIGTLF